MLRGGVTGFFQVLRERDFFQRQFLAELGAIELLAGHILPAWQPIGEMEPGRPLAGHDAGPRRRADRAGSIGLREPHSVGSEAVDVRRFVIRAAVAAQVRPAEVVHQDENDVGARRFGGEYSGGHSKSEGCTEQNDHAPNLRPEHGDAPKSRRTLTNAVSLVWRVVASRLRCGKVN